MAKLNKAFAKQDAELAAALKRMRESQNKVLSLAQDIYNADSAAKAGDVNKLIQAAAVLRQRIHRHAQIANRYDFMGC